MKEKAKQQIKLDISLQLRQMKKHRTHYLMMLPYALLFATFTLAPVVIRRGLGRTGIINRMVLDFITISNCF